MEELAPYMRGWRGYFGFCQTPEVLIALTRWVRLRLRAALWRQWTTPRRRRAALVANGVSEWAARHGRQPPIGAIPGESHIPILLPLSHRSAADGVLAYRVRLDNA